MSGSQPKVFSSCHPHKYAHPIVTYRMKGWLKRKSWLVLCHVLNFLDATLTLYATSRGVEEANPIMAWTLEVSPLFFAVVKFTVFGVAIGFLAQTRPSLLKLVAALFGVVVAWHISFWMFL